MIQIKYCFLKNSENGDFKVIQVRSQKEDTFRIIYKTINQKILEKQKLSLEQLILFCSFKMIKKMRNKINNQENQKETIRQFLKNESSVYGFKNFKMLTIEIIVDRFPKNIIKFSTG